MIGYTLLILHRVAVPQPGASVQTKGIKPGMPSIFNRMLLFVAIIYENFMKHYSMKITI